MFIVWIAISIVVAIFLLTALTGAPYVPTHKKQADEVFLTLRKVTKEDTVLDIGSGDGVVLKSALTSGAGRAVGYEINPILVLISWLRLLPYSKRAQVRIKNFWTSPFPVGTTVVYTFGESRDIGKMYQRTREEAIRLGRQIDFISYAFEVPDRMYDERSRAHFLYRITPLQPK